MSILHYILSISLLVAIGAALAFWNSRRVLAARIAELQATYKNDFIPLEKHLREISSYQAKLTNHVIAIDRRVKNEAEKIANVKFTTWKIKEEKNIRGDAIKRSQNVISGKVTENIIPFLPEFEWNPKDCRFLGSPIDFVVFDGLSDGDVKQIIFVEVKTGKHASLSTRERRVRDAVKKRLVKWHLLHKKQ